MLASLENKFVLLANPKSGSTAFEEAFAPYSEIRIAKPGHPAWKHITYGRIQAHFGDMFDRAGCTFYTVVRDPIDTLYSWYRFRSREALRRPNHSFARNYAGDMTFLDFAEAWDAGLSGPAKVPVSVDFCFDDSGEPYPMVYVPYERIDDLRVRLCRHVGHDVPVARRNLSPARGGRNVVTRLHHVRARIGRHLAMPGMAADTAGSAAGPLTPEDRAAVSGLKTMQERYEMLARIPFGDTPAEGVSRP